MLSTYIQRSGEKENVASTDFKHELSIKAIYPTILANPEVPSSEKEVTRLQDDAIFLLMAGTDAPGQVLAITTFHVLDNPSVHEKLRKELCSAIPDMNRLPDLVQLETLPYLVRCVSRPTWRHIH